MTQSRPKKPEDPARNRTVPEPSLEDTIPDLRLEDTAAQQRRGLAVRGSTLGYNPYDAGKPGVTPEQPARKPTDLHKLSEWIRAQRRAEAVRQEEQQSRGAGKPDPQRRK